MTIGEVAKRTGISTKMLRYYEQRGLLKTVARTAAGYRDYSANDVSIFSFIRRARELGFSLAETEELLNLWRDKTRKSADVRALEHQHMDVLQWRIDELQHITKALQELIQCCAGDERPECPILVDLASHAK